MKKTFSFLLSFILVSNQLVQFTFADEVQSVEASPDVISQETGSSDPVLTTEEPTTIPSSGSNSTGVVEDTGVITETNEQTPVSDPNSRINESSQSDGDAHTVSIDGELNASNVESVCSKSATSCGLSYLGITAVASGTFVGYSNLQSLDLSSNNISSISEGTFVGLVNLQNLGLHSNQISELPELSFKGLSNVTSISLYDNPIKIIRKGAFEGCSSMVSLGLEGLGIETVESEAFIGMPNLTYLGLYSNAIETLTGGVFSGLSNVTSFGINGNPIKLIRSNAFEGMSSISSLDFSGFPIETIEPYAFSGMTSLKSFEMHGAPITVLSNNTFAGLPILSTISLQGNQIQTIEEYAFRDLSKLVSLGLDGNDIGVLTGGVFAGLPNLTSFGIGGNPVKIIRSNAFEGMSSISSLDFSGFPIETIEPYAFSGMASLMSININGTTLSDLPNYVFGGLSSLQYLYMQSNQIGTIHEHSFAGLNNLIYLYLGGNHIKNIEENSFADLTNLSYIQVGGNRLVRDTLPQNIISFLDQYSDSDWGNSQNFPGCTNPLSSNYNSLANSDDGTCDTNIKLNNENIQRICDISSSYCGLYGYHINEIASDTFAGYDNLESISLGGNDLASLPNGLFSHLTHLRELDLSYNKITHLEDVTQAGMQNISNLGLYGNHIKEIKTTDIANFQNLEWLELSSNGIQKIESGAFDSLIATDKGGVSEVTSLGYVGLDSNCLDPENDEYLNNSSLYLGQQYVCVDVIYSPDTQTSGVVTGTLTFVGGPQSQRDGLLSKYSQIHDYTHTWIDNGLYTFDLTFLQTLISEEEEMVLASKPASYVGLDSIWQYEMGERFLPAQVSWIVASAGTKDGGGSSGGGSIKTKDRCLDGDFSKDYYDGKCKAPTTDSDSVAPVHSAAGSQPSTNISEDLQKAYQWAFTWGITSQKTIERAKVQDRITRGELAKMIVNYTKGVLGKKISSDKESNFKDLKGQTNEIKEYIADAYRLGLMGIGSDSFRPNEFVTRAEFATVLARLLYSNQDLSGETFFDKPIQLLKKDGILSNTDSKIQEARGYIMLMLMRAKK